MEDSSKLELECYICFDKKSVEKITFLPCIHFLCSQCYEQLKKNECPFCKNKLTEEEDDSYDETENEYHDAEFEMLVLGSFENRKRKKNKRNEKKIMRIIKDNNEMIISIGRRNTYEILSSLES